MTAQLDILVSAQEIDSRIQDLTTEIAGRLEEDAVVVGLLQGAFIFMADVVRDRGEGIPASEKTKVFERFHRIERAAQAHQPGTGLGLAIVRELIAAHGGSVALRDREGRGLEVIVSLPRA